MRIATTWADEHLTLELTPDASDATKRSKAKQARRHATVRLPGAVTEQLHPDLVALAGCLLVAPFANTVTLDRPVSPSFAAAARLELGLGIGPIDMRLEARRSPLSGRAALVFNGSHESLAMLAVMPESTLATVPQRATPPDVPAGKYRDDALIHAATQLAQCGREVEVISSDIEFTRDPTGYATDWTAGLGAVLAADALGIDAIAWPVIAEDAYRTGRDAFSDWRLRSADWARVFAAAGIAFLTPLAGVSELAAARIAASAGDSITAQDCLRGRVGRPCMTCWKCFRRTMIDGALFDRWVSVQELGEMLAAPEVTRGLTEIPIHHEPTIGWCALRYGGFCRTMSLLVARTPLRTPDYWTGTWYEPALESMPVAYRASIGTALDRHLKRMSEAEAAHFQAWDMRPHLAAREVAKLRDKLARALGKRDDGVIGRILGLDRRRP